jgi:hypothetical protein
MKPDNVMLSNQSRIGTASGLGIRSQLATALPGGCLARLGEVCLRSQTATLDGRFARTSFPWE